MSHSWPGNVRELENCIERLMVISQGDMLNEDYFKSDKVSSEDLRQSGNRASNIGESYDLFEIEKQILTEALEKAGWNKVKSSQNA